MGPLPGCQWKVKVNTKLVCGRTRAKISKIQGPSMPKNEVILELRGFMELLEVSDGAPPSIICSSPDRTPFVADGSRASNFWPAVFFEVKKHSKQGMFEMKNK